MPCCSQSARLHEFTCSLLWYDCDTQITHINLTIALADSTHAHTTSMHIIFTLKKNIQVMFSKCQRRCTWQLSPDSEIVLMWPLGWFLNTHLLVWLAFHFFEDEKLDKVNLWCAVGGYKWFAYRTVKEHKDFFFHLTMNNDLIASLNPIFSCAPLYVLVSESQFCADN